MKNYKQYELAEAQFVTDTSRNRIFDSNKTKSRWYYQDGEPGKIEIYFNIYRFSLTAYQTTKNNWTLNSDYIARFYIFFLFEFG